MPLLYCMTDNNNIQYVCKACEQSANVIPYGIEGNVTVVYCKNGHCIEHNVVRRVETCQEFFDCEE